MFKLIWNHASIENKVSTSPNGNSCLHWAAKLGHQDLVKWIMVQEQGAEEEIDFEQLNKEGKTPQQLAYEAGYEDIAAYIEGKAK